MTANILTAADRTEIAAFVRNDLGCQCPVEVFRSIVVSSGLSPVSGERFARILVGDRLLIYVMQPPLLLRPADAIDEVARIGMSERDEREYKRFRLVLAVTPEHPWPAAVVDRFEGATDADERAHLHLLPVETLPESIKLQR
jgi:hypothetical protein